MTSETTTTSSETSFHASIEWDSNGQPISSQFNDVYFSKASGINESRYVFLERNNLSSRFSLLAKNTDNDTFVIAETGFGTGLNFLCAWQLFEQKAPKQCQLHFFSTEKYPLHVNDLAKALSLWPELSQYTEQLTDSYLPASSGFHHLVFSEGRIRLTLLVGDVLKTLPLIAAKVDAWFLDGFSPAKNPLMWQPSLFQIMAEKSRIKATYATFTAARQVRENLLSAGFSVSKSPGFADKRDMIHGVLNAPVDLPQKKTLWNVYPVHDNSEKTAIIIGGGLAGTSSARALAERGWQVTLLEQHEQLAREASGNPQSILYAKLSANQTVLSRLIGQGYCYSLNMIRQLEKAKTGIRHACGVVQLCTSEAVRKRYMQLSQQYPKEFLQLHNRQQLSSIAGIDVKHDGLYFPESGWVSPPEVCQQLVRHSSISVKTDTHVDRLFYENNQWLLKNKGKTIEKAKIVIIAGGVSTHKLSQLAHIPLKSIRGQITRIKATVQSKKLNTCICGEGYAAPEDLGVHTIGATFDFNSESSAVSRLDHEKNLSMQSQWMPSFVEALGGVNCSIIGGKKGFRCTTPDYLPVVGPVVDKQCFLKDFAMLSKNTKYSFTKKPDYLQGLYVNAGHGSRGLITCPLSGELLASMINGDSMPLPADIIEALNPARFLVRNLSRGLIKQRD